MSHREAVVQMCEKINDRVDFRDLGAAVPALVIVILLFRPATGVGRGGGGNRCTG